MINHLTQTPLVVVPACAAAGSAHGTSVPAARLRHESAPATWQAAPAAKRQSVMGGTAAFGTTVITTAAALNDVTGSPPRGAPV